MSLQNLSLTTATGTPPLKNLDKVLVKPWILLLEFLMIPGLGT